MIQKKICMLGAFAVGKTSLVRRFVESIFSDTYRTTLGVKIDKKTVTIEDREITLILWDIHGEDGFQQVAPAYMSGMSGYLLVIDGTRPQTLEEASKLQGRAIDAAGAVPYVVALNKADMDRQWRLGDDDVPRVLQGRPAAVLKSSAKTGAGVEQAFRTLAEAALGKEQPAVS